MAIEFYHGVDFVNEEITEPPFLLNPIIPAFGIVLLHGAPGTGKSAFTWNLANSVNCGGNYLDFTGNSSGNNVLFINIDMPKYGLYHRWKQAGFQPQFDLLITQPFNCTGINFQYGQFYKDIKELYNNGHYKLVIIDALGEVCIGMATGSDDLPMRVYSCFREWFPDSCVMFIHHDRKRKLLDSGGFAPATDEDASGSQYWKAYATVTLHLYKQNSEIRVLHYAKSQIAEDGERWQLYLDESGIKVNLWDEHEQQLEIEAYQKAVEMAKQVNPNWPKLSDSARVKLIAKLIGKSPRTIYRWKKAMGGVE